MKKIILFLLILSLFSSLLYSQPNRDRLRDNIWLMGENGLSSNPILGVTSIDFSADTLRMTKYPTAMNFTAYSTSLCDTTGHLMAYSNGIYIANKIDATMPNGDSLDYGTAWELGKVNGSPFIQSGAIALPNPCSNNCATMVYLDTEYNPTGYFWAMGIKVATIDFNNGLGAVTQKEINIVSDTIQGNMITACRHANGRDWWIITPRVGLNKYYRNLLTPHGIISKPPQIMPAVWADYSKGYYACFSPDGTKYAHYDNKYAIWLYDFDRCEGLLSNRRPLPVDQSPTGADYAGIAFSPNSRYLYQTNNIEVRQFDTYASDIPSTMTVVAVCDSFTYLSTGGTITRYTKFMHPVLAPNGKIYINTPAPQGRYLHVIESPNEGGLACNLRQHAIVLPTNYRISTPNFPYFRLGAERGTVCDSLGIETGVTVGTSNPQNPPLASLLRAYPNPTTGLFYIENLPENATVRVYDALGKEVFAPFAAYKNEINLNNAPKGVYFCSVFVHKKYFKTLKIVKIE